MSELKELRASKKLTQEEASALLGVSLRSYKSYENDESKRTTIKYRIKAISSPMFRFIH